ncbi:MAG: hypothetical protein IPM29_10580, partial [Planctomycetes bacterium]|nr:hypothetical protein [Planctomycetota bacterium]
MSTSRNSTLAPALALLCTACPSPPPPAPFEPPELETEVRHFHGALLGGPLQPGLQPDDHPTAPDTALDPADLLLAQCTVLYVDRVPDVGEPLAGDARLIVGERGSEPLLPTTVLTPAARVLQGDAQTVLAAGGEPPPRTVPVAVPRGVLPRGVSLVFSCAAPDDQLLQNGQRVRRQLAVFVSRPGAGQGDALRVSLVVEDLDRSTGRDGPALGDAVVVQRQLVVLDAHPEPGGAPLALLFPSPFPGQEGRGFLAFLEVKQLDPAMPGAQRMVDDCARDLQSSAASAIARALRVIDS